jgi:hypothetical protein
MTWRQVLQLYSIMLILKLFSPFMSPKIHGALLNRLLAFFDQDERHQIAESFLREVALQPYDKHRHFSSAEEDVDYYLRFVPHLQPYRSVMVNICRNKRQAAGLKEKTT